MSAVSIKDTPDAKAAPVSLFLEFSKLLENSNKTVPKTAERVSGAPHVAITVTPAPHIPVQRKIPTLAEYKALPKDQQIHWQCLDCDKPALEDAFMPGSYCSKLCAYYGYS